MKGKIEVMQKTLGSVDLDTYYVKEFTKEMKEKKLPICSDEKLKALLSAIG